MSPDRRSALFFILLGTYDSLWSQKHHQSTGTRPCTQQTPLTQDLAPNKQGHVIPRFVNLAFQKGYTITNSGSLWWAPTPPAILVPSARLRFLASEALFCIIFFADPVSLDLKWSQILLWQRESVTWLHLCSHVSLIAMFLSLRRQTTSTWQKPNLLRTDARMRDYPQEGEGQN